MITDFKGKTALVTGASKGIGKAVALELASRGCNLILTHNSDETGARLVEAACKKLGSKILVIKADLANEKERVALSKCVFEFTKKLDVIINNAGFHDVNDGKDASDELLEKYFSVHAIAPLRIASLLRKLMHDKTSIVNVSSKNATLGRPITMGYSASKAALNSFTKTMAQTYAPIRVNSVSPGPVLTPMWEGESKAGLKHVADATLLKRFATPEEIAKVIVFVASDDASYMTGSDIVVDGGALVKNNY